MRAVAVVALVFAGACLETDPETSDAVQTEVVLEEPTPHAWCSGCGQSRVLGEPVTVMTAYYGTCKLFWEYDCNPQPYTATITCDGVPCEMGAASSSASDFYTRWPVKPLGEGSTTIRTTITGTGGGLVKTFTMGTVKSYVPDSVVASCYQANDEPCVAMDNVYPVYIRFALRAGTVQLYESKPWTVTINGVQSTITGGGVDIWESGNVTVTGQYGALSATVTVHVAPEPPPPPPPMRWSPRVCGGSQCVRADFSEG